MLSLRFTLRLVTIPWVVLKTTVQYWTTGTALQADQAEFGNSLQKNIGVAVLAHIAKGMHGIDAKTVVVHPMNGFYDQYKKLGGSGMPRFGDPVADSSRFTWVVCPEGAKKAILFLHGGGYLVPLTKSQFVGIMGVWYAVDSEKRQDLAIAALDYSLTSYGHRYPTQIFEAVEAYRKLVELGYEVTLLGDSCGANLALAVSRFAAYPEEARAHFSKYSQFAWDFSPLPVPRYLVLVAPWLQPYTKPEKYPGVNYEGDLGSQNTEMGDEYIGKEPKSEVGPWVDFYSLDFDRSLSKIPALNGEGASLVLYGEREIFRVSQEDFFKRITTGNISIHMQPGAIHDSMFYVEPLDIASKKGQANMVAGKHRAKFSFGLTADFLEKHL